MRQQTLSLRQPYAWLVAAGIKGFENRSRVFPRVGEFWVHASKFDMGIEETILMLERQYEIWIPRDLTFGAIIGRSSVVRAVYDSDPLVHAWRIKKSAGYILDPTKARLLETPQTTRGQLGWFLAEVRDPRFSNAPVSEWAKNHAS